MCSSLTLAGSQPHCTWLVNGTIHQRQLTLSADSMSTPCPSRCWTITRFPKLEATRKSRSDMVLSVLPSSSAAGNSALWLMFRSMANSFGVDLCLSIISLACTQSDAPLVVVWIKSVTHSYTKSCAQARITQSLHGCELTENSHFIVDSYMLALAVQQMLRKHCLVSSMGKEWMDIYSNSAHILGVIVWLVDSEPRWLTSQFVSGQGLN